MAGQSIQQLTACWCYTSELDRGASDWLAGLSWFQNVEANRNKRVRVLCLHFNNFSIHEYQGQIIPRTSRPCNYNSNSEDTIHYINVYARLGTQKALFGSGTGTGLARDQPRWIRGCGPELKDNLFNVGN